MIYNNLRTLIYCRFNQSNFSHIIFLDIILRHLFQRIIYHLKIQCDEGKCFTHCIGPQESLMYFIAFGVKNKQRELGKNAVKMKQQFWPGIQSTYKESIASGSDQLVVFPRTVHP